MREPEQMDLTFESEQVQVVRGYMRTEVWLPEANEGNVLISTGGPLEFFIVNGGLAEEYIGKVIGGPFSVVVRDRGNAFPSHNRTQLRPAEIAYCRYFPDLGKWIVGKFG